MSRRLLSSAVAVVVLGGCGLGVGTAEEGGFDSAASGLAEFEGDVRQQIDRNEALVVDGLRSFHVRSSECLAPGASDCLAANLSATLGPAGAVQVTAPAASTLPLEGSVAQGNKWGYAFRLQQSTSSDGGSAWGLDAFPIVYRRTGISSFYIDETGILLGSDVAGGGPIDGGMPEI